MELVGAGGLGPSAADLLFSFASPSPSPSPSPPRTNGHPHASPSSSAAAAAAAGAVAMPYPPHSRHPGPGPGPGPLPQSPPQSQQSQPTAEALMAQPWTSYLPTLRILVVFACPSNSSPLRLQSEEKVIRDCLAAHRLGPEASRIELKVLPACTIDEFSRQLMVEKYHIIHFSGHADRISVFVGHIKEMLMDRHHHQIDEATLRKDVALRQQIEAAAERVIKTYESHLSVHRQIRARTLPRQAMASGSSPSPSLSPPLPRSPGLNGLPGGFPQIQSQQAFGNYGGGSGQHQHHQHHHQHHHGGYQGSHHFNGHGQIGYHGAQSPGHGGAGSQVSVYGNGNGYGNGSASLLHDSAAEVHLRLESFRSSIDIRCTVPDKHFFQPVEICIERDYRHEDLLELGVGSLAFENELGRASFIPPQSFANLLSSQESLQCIIINACSSIIQGKILHSCVPFTICYSSEISDQESIAFSHGFYDALGLGYSVHDSYRQGLSRVELKRLGPGMPKRHLLSYEQLIVCYTNEDLFETRFWANSFSVPPRFPGGSSHGGALHPSAFSVTSAPSMEASEALAASQDKQASLELENGKLRGMISMGLEMLQSKNAEIEQLKSLMRSLVTGSGQDGIGGGSGGGELLKLRLLERLARNGAESNILQQALRASLQSGGGGGGGGTVSLLMELLGGAGGGDGFNSSKIEVLSETINQKLNLGGKGGVSSSSASSSFAGASASSAGSSAASSAAAGANSASAASGAGSGGAAGASSRKERKPVSLRRGISDQAKLKASLRKSKEQASPSLASRKSAPTALTGGYLEELHDLLFSGMGSSSTEGRKKNKKSQSKMAAASTMACHKGSNDKNVRIAFGYRVQDNVLMGLSSRKTKIATNITSKKSASASASQSSQDADESPLRESGDDFLSNMSTDPSDLLGDSQRLPSTSVFEPLPATSSPFEPFDGSVPPLLSSASPHTGHTRKGLISGHSPARPHPSPSPSKLPVSPNGAHNAVHDTVHDASPDAYQPYQKTSSPAPSRPTLERAFSAGKLALPLDRSAEGAALSVVGGPSRRTASNAVAQSATAATQNVTAPAAGPKRPKSGSFSAAFQGITSRYAVYNQPRPTQTSPSKSVASSTTSLASASTASLASTLSVASESRPGKAPRARNKTSDGLREFVREQRAKVNANTNSNSGVNTSASVSTNGSSMSAAASATKRHIASHVIVVKPTSSFASSVPRMET